MKILFTSRLIDGQTAKLTAYSALIREYVASAVIIGADYIAVVLALVAASHLCSAIIPTFIAQANPFNVKSAHIFYAFPLCYIAFLAYAGMYSRRTSFWQAAEALFEISAYAAGLIFVITYFTGDAEGVSLIFVFAAWLLSFIFLVVFRYFTKRGLYLGGLWQKRVLMLGAGETAQLLAREFAGAPYMGYKIIGLIADHNDRESSVGPYIGTLAQAEQAILASGVADVIIVAPGLDRGQLADLVYRLQPCVRNVLLVPDLLGLPFGNLRVQTFCADKIVLLNLRNNLSIGYNILLKRVFDFVLSTLGTAMISPLLVAIGVAIYLDSPGPVVFAHMRVGAQGKLFPCYKFRSMLPNAQSVLAAYLEKNPSDREQWERDFKLKYDPRITAVGKVLRRTSLDELPQLLNVIRGEMSLVGPRPIVEKEVSKYGEYIKDYHMVRPGITGLWQVSGRNDVDYDTRVQLDSWYVRNWSLWLDIVLLFKTVKVVVSGKGAY